MTVCSNCGRENSDDARFCSGCATPVAAESLEPPTVRKVVTVLFSDLVDSTPLGEQLDAETFRRVLGRWHDEARRVIEHHGGTVEKFVGDAVMAVFGIPTANEDDAIRAVRSAAEMRLGVAALNAERGDVRIQTRTGITTGEVVTGTGETLVTGDPVNVAARLEQNAQSGEILIGEPTFELVREIAVVEPVEPLDLKGKSDSVNAWRLLGVVPEVPAFARTITTSFVGRGSELELLRGAFDAAVAESRCHLVTVLGQPGIGKSRLLREFVASLGEAPRVVVGRCLPYGEGITYSPLVDIVKQLAGEGVEIASVLAGHERGEPAAQLVEAAIGSSPQTGSTDEIHWAVRKLFEALAAEQPLVVVLEDLHWAEATFLDLVEYVAGFGETKPILLLATSRPELLDTRASLAKPELYAHLLFLEPLAELEVEALIDDRLASRDLSEELRAHTVEVAEGNPLFVEQLLALEQESGEGLVVPPTLRALLTSRIDLLEPSDRAVIERAAVEGRSFHRGAVAALLSVDERDDVGGRLLGLIRKELIRRDRSEFPGDDGFRFAHVLIRDAAYDAMPKELRSELHERYASWLEGASDDWMRERDAILGYHLEQAARYREELGYADGHARSLAIRASERLASAAKGAMARDDDAGAAALLTSAVELRPVGDQIRVELLPGLARAFAQSDDVARGQAVFEQAVEEARVIGDRVVEWRALLVLGLLRFSVDPRAVQTEELRRTAEEGLEVFDELGEEAAKADAYELLAQTHEMWGEFEQLERVARSLIRSASGSGDPQRERAGRYWLGEAIMRGPTPVSRGISQLEDLLSEPGVGTFAGANHMAHMAALRAMSGDHGAAMALLHAAREAGREVGTEWEFRGIEFLVAVLEDRPEDGEPLIRSRYEGYQRSGQIAYLTTAAAHLGRVVLALGHDEEAAELIRLSEETAAADDVLTQMLWRSVRAELLAKQGHFAEAERLASEAVLHVERTDALNETGDALLTLARVLQAADRSGDALPVAERALSVYEQKGNLVSAGKARALVAELRSG